MEAFKVYIEDLVIDMIEEIRRAYEKTFAIFLLANSPFMELDELFSEVNVPVVDDMEMNRWQKDNLLGLKYFYLMTRAKINKLSEDDIDKIMDIIKEPSEENMKIFLEIIQRTYNDVMCINPDKKDEATCIGSYSDIKYVFDNDSIVIGFGKGLGFDESDNLIESETERKCTEIISNIKDKLLPEMNDALGTKICLFEE